MFELNEEIKEELVAMCAAFAAKHNIPIPELQEFLGNFIATIGTSVSMSKVN